MTANETVNLIQYLFSEWNKGKVCYVVVRGWTGSDLVGSDIDILLDNESWTMAVFLAENLGFQKVTRSWKLLDFGATECYLDKELTGRLVRLHLSNRLVFGKPMRKIRLPYEKAVLRKATFDTQSICFKNDPSWQQVIDLYRLTIDKPEKITTKLMSTWKFDSSYLQPELISCINNLLPSVYKFLSGSLLATQLEVAAIRSLMPLVGSQYLLRQIQTMISQLLIMMSRIFHKAQRTLSFNNK